jgi:hypothetical protein
VCCHGTKLNFVEGLNQLLHLPESAVVGVHCVVLIVIRALGRLLH